MRKRPGTLGKTVGALLVATVFFAALPAGVSDPGTAGTPPGLGRFVENTTTGEITGTFVSFMAPASGSIIADFSSQGVAFFDSVAVPGYSLQSKLFVGTLARIEGTGALAQVHDVPSSALSIDLAGNTTVTFDLSTGVSAAWGTNGTINLSDAASGRSASVWTDCGEASAAIDPLGGGFAVTSSFPCSVFVRSRVLDPTTEALITGAAESGQLGAEVSVGANAADGSDVAAYTDATVIVTHAPGRVVVAVESLSSTPTSVIVRFVAPASNERTQVLVDGRPVALADSLEDSLNPTNDGTTVEYSVSTYDATGILVVSMPSPGTHVIEIQTIPVSGGRDITAPLVGLSLGIVAASVGAIALFRRR